MAGRDVTVLTRKWGEVIELGGGVTLAVRGVGRTLVQFRATLPAGVSLRLAVRPPRKGRTSRTPSAGILRLGKAKPWNVGFVVYPGTTAVIGEAIRLTVRKIEDPGRGRPRVARIAVSDGRQPPGPTVNTPAKPSVRRIDELTPDELARAVGWASPPRP